MEIKENGIVSLDHKSCASFVMVVISMASHSAMRCTISTAMVNASLLTLAGRMWPPLYRYAAVIEIPHTKSSTAGTVQKGLLVTIG